MSRIHPSILPPFHPSILPSFQSFHPSILPSLHPSNPSTLPSFHPSNPSTLPTFDLVLARRIPLLRLERGISWWNPRSPAQNGSAIPDADIPTIFFISSGVLLRTNIDARYPSRFSPLRIRLILSG